VSGRGDWGNLGCQATVVQQRWQQPVVTADLLGLDSDRVGPARFDDVPEVGVPVVLFALGRVGRDRVDVDVDRDRVSVRQFEPCPPN
jgi:hypothetical protein